MPNMFDLLEGDIDDPANQKAPVQPKAKPAEKKPAAKANTNSGKAKPMSDNVPRTVKNDKRKDFERKREGDRSGRGRGRGRGRNDGAGGEGRNNRREFDRRSASGHPNNRNAQKREGGGAYNWGNEAKEFAEGKGVAGTDEAPPKKEGEENAAPAAAEEEEDEEPTMTLAEFQAQQKAAREALGAPKVRKAGEGEKGDLKGKFVQKKADEVASNNAPKNTAAERKNKKENAAAALTNFKAAPIESRDSYGSGGRGGRGRGRGGRGEGRGNGRGGRGGRGDRNNDGPRGRGRAPRADAPDVQNDEMFPSL